MKRVVLYVVLTAILFGTMEVVLKIGGTGFDSVQLTFLRFFIGGVVLVPFGVADLKRRQIQLTRDELLWMVALGTMCIPISMLVFQLGIEHCNASTAASIICLNPLFTMVIAHLFTNEKMDHAKWLAFGIGLVAAFFMIRPWDIQEGNTPIGLLYMFIASITFAAYTVMGRRTIARVGAFAQTSMSFMVGSAILLAVLLTTGRPVLDGVVDNWLIVAYAGICVTGLGYIFYFMAIRYADATTGSIAFFIKPAIAPVLAMIFLHETIKWNTVLGIVLLISASCITLYDTYDKHPIARGAHRQN